MNHKRENREIPAAKVIVSTEFSDPAIRTVNGLNNCYDLVQAIKEGIEVVFV